MFYNGILIIIFFIFKYGVRGFGFILEKNVKIENFVYNCEIFIKFVDKDLIFIIGK